MHQSEQFIEVYEKAISPALCKQFIDIFENSEHKEIGRTGGGVDLDKKRSFDALISSPQFEPVYQAILPIITKYVMAYFAKYHFALIGPIGLTVRHPKTGQAVKLNDDNFSDVGQANLSNLVQHLFRLGEINMQKYVVQQGGYPYWHSEVFPQIGHNESLHRVLLFMFYLNDVEDGGETEFVYQNVKIKPNVGSMVIAPAYFTHTHRGNVPHSNDKYILTSWVLFNQAEQIYKGQGS
ncbi:2OG-Fe(II) oxygenase [Paraglaciecola sp.]|uniref:2OG-Fe(II) oxygenase n=1 Tax=Paraglaciecola sp. TaxID=1920173 RepID=UPI00273FADCE|nr:2OG-Fe(II) oxygenase [Paraglaciecola sp.]MDP5031602.1 2OG-Fe(II) oxygenase [Paraglaciecola sp.]